MKIMIYFFLFISLLADESFVTSFKAYKGSMQDVSFDYLELLKEYIPKIYIDKKSYAPLDFYSEYLEDTYLYKDKKVGRKLISKNPTREDLINYIDNEEYFLDYKVSSRETLADKDYSSTIYGRVYRDRFEYNGQEEKLLILKYNLVFPYSGLPQGLNKLKSFGASILGNKKAWHELDIHGAIHVIIKETTMKPKFIILAQHNHHRVYKWSEENYRIIMSSYSNEPYLYKDSGTYQRTIGNPLDIHFLFAFDDDEPISGGFDYIGEKDEVKELDLELKVLEEGDPLYTSAMLLGNKPKLLGLFDTWYKNGPPGMDYYTFPELKDINKLLTFWYIQEGDLEYITIYNRDIKSFGDYRVEALLEYQKQYIADVLFFD